MTNEASHDQAAGSVGGIDSHRDTIHVAGITDTGRPVDDREFPTTEAGYRETVAWLNCHGPLQAVRVEGTSSYGTGMCAALTAADVVMVEVNRTRPAERRKRGKTDPLAAYRAARSVLFGEAATDPRRASINLCGRQGEAPRGAVPTAVDDGYRVRRGGGAGPRRTKYFDNCRSRGVPGPAGRGGV